MAKPLVTANQVTAFRLALLPLGTGLIYQGRSGIIAAIVVMTFVGCTDILDGYLARRYGPTVLGGLMDPIVDKIFVVATVMPLVHFSLFPAWALGLLLLREFSVTGLRSLYERRGVKLKTTLLAKIKTWVQMAGTGVLVLMNITPPPLMFKLLLLGALLPYPLALLWYLVRGRVWRGAFIFSAWWIPVAALFYFGGGHLAGAVLLGCMLLVTWLSGWGYFAQSGRLLQIRPLDLSDVVRVATAALPLVLLCGKPPSVASSLMLNAIISLEMAAGGLDNLLCHHNAQSPALGWGLRVVLVVALSATGVCLGQPGGPLERAGLIPDLFTGAALVVSALGTMAEFVRGRSYYLDQAEKTA